MISLSLGGRGLGIRVYFDAGFSENLLKYLHLSLYQIYVEVPRARLTMELAKIRESQGKVAEAATILQELQVCVCVCMRTCMCVRACLRACI